MRTDLTVGIVRRVLDAANRQDVDAWAGLCGVNATNHERPTGREGVRGIFRSPVTAFPDRHVELGEVVADGDAVMCEEIMSGTHLGTPDLPVLGGLLVVDTPTGKRITIQSIHFYRIADGEIIEHRAVRDDLGIMQQLGLIGSPTHGAGDVSRLALQRRR